jgi:hypothetical protein
VCSFYRCENLIIKHGENLFFILGFQLWVPEHPQLSMWLRLCLREDADGRPPSPPSPPPDTGRRSVGGGTLDLELSVMPVARW